MAEILKISLSGKLRGVILAYSNDAEKALVERAKKDPQAFGLLFDKYYDDIYRYAVHRVGDSDVAKDITSDTFHRALDKIWTFKWMSLPFSAWLYRIAANEINGYFRKRKKNQSIQLNEEVVQNSNISLSQENEFNKSSLFENLRKAIAALNIKYQEVITLKYFEGKSIAEISEITGKAEGTVKSLIHRGLKQLEKEIDEDLYKDFSDE